MMQKIIVSCAVVLAVVGAYFGLQRYRADTNQVEVQLLKDNKNDPLACKKNSDCHWGKCMGGTCSLW